LGEVNPSEVSERLEVRVPEAAQPDLALLAEVSEFPPASGESAPGPASRSAAGIPLSWLRLGYALVFLIALLAIVTMWSEIGGEGHLDLMPWYIKLGCILGLAWCSVRLTASVVEQPRVWTARTIRWLIGIVFFCLLMGGITYYYHLHEPADDDDGDDNDTTAAAVKIIRPESFFYHGDQKHGDQRNGDQGFGGPSTGLSPGIRFLAGPRNAGRDRISARSHGGDPGLRL
jgi:hypothetical protein